MMKKGLSLLLILFLLLPMFPNSGISAASNGNGNGNGGNVTAKNILYLSGNGGSKDKDNKLSNYIEKYFPENIYVKVYHQEIKTFKMSDFTKRKYEAIYVSSSVRYNIESNNLDANVLSKLKAFDYPTVVDNELAVEFGLAQSEYEMMVIPNNSDIRVADQYKVFKLPDHKEFSLDILSKNTWLNPAVQFEYFDMYSDQVHGKKYEKDFRYTSVGNLLPGAIAAVNTEEIKYHNKTEEHTIVFGYEKNNAALDNSKRVAGCFGTNQYAEKYTIQSIYLISNAVWWVMQEGASNLINFQVQTYDDVSQQILASNTISIESEDSYELSYIPQDGYEFLKWVKVNSNGTFEDVGTTLNVTVSPVLNSVYRAVVQKVYKIEKQTYDKGINTIIDRVNSNLRAGNNLELIYTDRLGYKFDRWVSVNVLTGSITLISNEKSIVVTPTQNTVYRAEISVDLSLPAKLRILEVQPKNTFVLDESYLTSRLGVEVELTQIPMSIFIAQRDQLNGKYDVIYLGEQTGTYVPAMDASLKFTGTLYGTNIKSFNDNSTIGEYYSPNDITRLRADELLEFINSGQLALFNSNSFSTSTDTILKQKFKNITKTNVKTLNTISNDTIVTELSKYATETYETKPILTVMAHPEDFIGSDGESHYLTNPSDRYMSFNFKLDQFKADHEYTANLYLDFDANNIFSEVDQELVVTNEIYSENFDNVLLRYNLPKEYIGFVPWKIEVVDTTTNVKAYEIGYAAFKGLTHADQGVKHIKVLQITPDGGGSYKLTELPSKLKAITGLYDLTITQTTVSAYNSNPFELNGKYDMLVLGFADSLSVNLKLNDAAIARIQSYIDSGQSVLTTHDQFWFDLDDLNTSTMKMTEQFRNQFGQNIYMKDYIDGDKPVENSSMLPYTTIGNKTYKAVGFSDRDLNRPIKGLPTTNKSTEINEGQITLFPYILDSVLDISTTHFQYFQLDMEREDLMVWHNLYGGNYDGLDAQNDYYVYSIDNITYSGTGHASPKTYNDENELFVNTMIKASKTANHAPSVVISGISDGVVFNKSQSTIAFDLTVTDIDLKDTTSLVKIYIDTNNNGVGDLLVKTIENFTNDILTNVTLEKTLFNHLDEFNIVVIAEDSKGAQGQDTVDDVINSSLVALAINQDSAWDKNAVLVGDTASLNLEIEKVGTGNDSFTDIGVTLTIKQADFDALSSETYIEGWGRPLIVDGNYVYSRTVENIDENIIFMPTFDLGEGTLNVDIDLSYKNYGTSYSTHMGPKMITVVMGELIIAATDRFNRPVGGQTITISSVKFEESVTSLADKSVALDVASGSDSYKITYTLSGYKDAKIVVTNKEGFKTEFTRLFGSNQVIAEVELSTDNTPIDIALILYQDTITNEMINGNVGLIVSKENLNGTTVFENLGEMKSSVGISYQLDYLTSRVEIKLDDDAFMTQVVPGTGVLSYNKSADNLGAVLKDSNGAIIPNANITFDNVTKSFIVAMPTGVYLEAGIYSLDFVVRVPKGLKTFTENQPHSITVKSLTTVVNVDGIVSGPIVKNVDKKIIIGYLVFTDNTAVSDGYNGLVGFKTKSTNILEGAGYGNVELYIKPSMDVSFENVNIRLTLKYEKEEEVGGNKALYLAEMNNNENFYMINVENVEGLERNSVQLLPVAGGGTNEKEILITQLPKATSADEQAIITVKIFVENSKFNFQNYRLVFSLIYGIDVAESEIRQNIEIIKRLKLY